MGRGATSDLRTFPVTRWSLVGRAGAGDLEALEHLLTRYLPALKAHLTAGRGVAPTDADDLLQEFVHQRVLRGQLLARVRQRKGHFRTWLLSTLDNFAVDQPARQTDVKYRQEENQSHRQIR